MSKTRVDRIENRLGQFGFNVADLAALTNILQGFEGEMTLDGAEQILFDENFDYSEGTIGHRLLGEFFLDRQNHTGTQLASTIGLLTGIAAGTNTAIVPGDNLLQALAKLQAQISAGGIWNNQPIGVPFPIWDHITGVPVPPSNNANYRYVKLTASDAYNSGILTSESVSGTAPLVLATAVVSDATSPINGQTINLINTERRVIRAGQSGTVQDDTMQGHRHSGLNYGGSSNLGSAAQYIGVFATGDPISDGVNGTPRVSNETRSKNIGATYYMRIR